MKNNFDAVKLITEKVDGSLGICFYDNILDKWRIVTRGCFNSDQALFA